VCSLLVNRAGSRGAEATCLGAVAASILDHLDVSPSVPLSGLMITVARASAGAAIIQVLAGVLFDSESTRTAPTWTPGGTCNRSSCCRRLSGRVAGSLSWRVSGSFCGDAGVPDVVAIAPSSTNEPCGTFASPPTSLLYTYTTFAFVTAMIITVAQMRCRCWRGGCHSG